MISLERKLTFGPKILSQNTCIDCLWAGSPPPDQLLNICHSAFDVNLESKVWWWPWGCPQLLVRMLLKDLNTNFLKSRPSPFYLDSLNPLHVPCCDPPRPSLNIIHSENPPQWLSGKESTCNVGDAGDADSIPGSGKYPGAGNGNPCQCSCLGNPWTGKPDGLQCMGLQKSQAQLSN